MPTRRRNCYGEKKRCSPDMISRQATIQILTPRLSGVHEGDKDCLKVMRGFGAPTVTPTDLRNCRRTPNARSYLFRPHKCETVVPYYELA